MKRRFKHLTAIATSALITIAVLLGGHRLIAASITGTVAINPRLIHTGTSSLTSLSETISQLFTWTVTASATNAPGLDMLWSDTRTISGADGETLDLYGGITNSFGEVMNFRRVKFMVIAPASTNYGTIQMGGGDVNTFTNWIAGTNDAIKVPAGAIAAFFSPETTAYVVSNGFGDNLFITNNHATSNGTYDIYIGGQSQ